MTGKKVAKGTVYFFLTHLITLFLRAILIFFLARLLGPYGYGRYASVLAFCLIVEMFFRSGISGSIAKAIAEDKEKVHTLVQFGFRIQLTYSGFIALMVFVGSNFWSRFVFNDATLSPYLTIAALYFVPLALFEVGNGILLGFRMFGRQALLQCLHFLLRVVCILLLFFIYKSISAVFFGMFTSALLALVFLVFAIPKLEKKKVYIDRKRIIIIAASLIISGIIVRAVFQIDKLLLKNLIGKDEIVGIYALGSNLAIILQLFAFSLMTALFPSISSSFAHDDAALTHKYLIEGTRYLTLMVFSAALVFTITGKDLIPFIFGKSYLQSVIPFNILIFASIFFSFFLLYQNLLIPLNRYFANILIAIVVIISTLSLNVIFIKGFGFLGASFATLFASIIGAFISGRYIFRFLGLKFPWHSTLKIGLIFLICFYLAHLTESLTLVHRCVLYTAVIFGFGFGLYFTKEITGDDIKVIKEIFIK